MNFFEAIILGVIEGITEFLPVSSTGHLILTADLLGIAPTDFTKSFEIVIQSGAILAVVVLYGQRLLFSPELAKRIFVAFLPSAGLGLLLYPLVKRLFLANTAMVLSSLFFGGVAIVLFESWYKRYPPSSRSTSELSYFDAFVVGLFQAIALIPGVSRAGATVMGGLALGLDRKTIVEFSFLLAIPTMITAAAFDLFRSASSFEGGNFFLLFSGFMTAFFVALFAVSWLLRYIARNDFTAFGYYRILLALGFWAWIVFV